MHDDVRTLPRVAVGRREREGHGKPVGSWSAFRLRGRVHGEHRLGVVVNDVAIDQRSLEQNTVFRCQSKTKRLRVIGIVKSIAVDRHTNSASGRQSRAKP